MKTIKKEDITSFKFHKVDVPCEKNRFHFMIRISVNRFYRTFTYVVVGYKLHDMLKSIFHGTMNCSPNHQQFF